MHRGTPAAPDLVWSSDIIAIAITITINEVWLHMTAKPDLFSRQATG